MNLEIKKVIGNVLKNNFSETQGVKFDIETPKQKDHGDYACNIAMVLSKKVGKNPREIAEGIVNILKNDEQFSKKFSKIDIAGPGFINFYLSPETLSSNLESILKDKRNFGKSELGKGKTVVIDFSSINIAKPMHVGHLRSTIIGQSLFNIYKALGYKVISDNHIGDWGTQFGKMIYAYKNWGSKKQIAKDPIEEMMKLYVRFHKESEINEELNDMARKETFKLQSGDAENLKIWKFMVRESLKDADKIYKILGTKFDLVLGESFYNDMLPGIVEEALSKGVAKESEGAIIVDLDDCKLPPFLIRKSDGGHLYATTDLATLKYRKEKLKADIILYVVANEQALHFEQLFASSEKIGLSKGVELKHVKFGMVLGEDGKKFSTRKGKIVSLDDLIAESLNTAKKILEEKNPKLSQKDKKKIAKVVGLGAMKYNDLSQNRLTDIVFDWDKMLSFEGNSSTYLQYTYARIYSLHSKYKKENSVEYINVFKKNDFTLLKEKAEIEVMRELIKFPEAIQNSAKENTPHLLALYLYNLANSYNAFYNSYSILKSDKDLARARLALSGAVAVVIRNGLELLGIDVVKKM